MNHIMLEISLLQHICLQYNTIYSHINNISKDISHFSRTNNKEDNQLKEAVGDNA